MESLQGKLLVSSPSLVDPNFRKTVVLVAHHDDDGAMGLVLSRPSNVSAADAVPLLDGLPGSDDPDELWRTVLHRKGGPFSLMENMPFDPGLN